jgi:hypothetical protein
MTTATKERRKARTRPEQAELKDAEGVPLAGEKIKELEDVGMELDEVRTKRVVLNAEEAELQTRCVESMKKHDLMSYKLKDGRFLMREHKEEDKVKIKKPGEDDKPKRKRKGRSGEADFGDE